MRKLISESLVGAVKTSIVEEDGQLLQIVEQPNGLTIETPVTEPAPAHYMEIERAEQQALKAAERAKRLAELNKGAE